MAYNYALEYPVAAEAPAEARAAFIRRTYGHLAVAILAFVGLTALLMNIPGVKETVINGLFRGGRFGWLVVFGAYFLVSMVANKWAMSDVSRGVQYLGLGLFIVAEAIIFMPILWIASEMTDPYLIPGAAVATLAIFGGLTLAVFITGRDFSFMGSALCVLGFLAIGFMVASIIFGFSLGMVFSYAMVALMSGYILYDTSNVLYHYRTDQHVAASLALFSSVATLFWWILRIFMSRD
jgi:FtsH-binding integral membrane protein